jgi:pyruvate dehydrogenase E2 component (dihydrolipoamide acetyltransferase)
MSQLGLSMDSGQIIQWLKQSGDNVKAGELLLEVESDKSTVEVESVESGILHIVLEPEDGDIPVGKVIAYLLAEGEQPPVSEKPAVPTAGDPNRVQGGNQGTRRDTARREPKSCGFPGCHT